MLNDENDPSVYMNGRGIVDRTRRLTGDMWDAVPLAVMGSMLMVVGLGAAGGQVLCLYHGLTQWGWGSGGIILVGTFLGGAGSIGPIVYNQAERRLRDHRCAVEAETERLGRGWAKS
jgi:hypothetical protein